MPNFQINVMVVLALFWIAIVPAKAGGYENGVAAFEAGDFAGALAQWRSLAIQEHPEAQYALGRMYEYGRGVERSDSEAIKWYLKSASKDVVDAQYRLAVLNDNGWGIARNYEEAVHWYQKAADRGHVLAQHDLAFMYAAGTGISQDYLRAYMWLNIAMTQRSDLMTKHLNYIATKMTDAQISEAQILAREWVPKTAQ